MSDFKIPIIPRTENKTVRFPISMIEQVEKELVGKNASFTGFVVEAVRCALASLEKQRQSSAKE